MHLEYIANGLGAPSLMMVMMAIKGELPATVAIAADTGWELDRLWTTGRRSTNQQYFDEVVVPLCKGSKVKPVFVRAVDENKRPLIGLGEFIMREAESGTISHIPMFGSKGGRMMQSCTDKWKIRAIRQEARRMGAKTARGAQGIHFTEAVRRVKGKFIGMEGKWSVYRTTVTRKKVVTEIKWCSHYYPLVDLKMTRESIYREVERAGVPYIISSECDLCPHKDFARWDRTSPAVIDEAEKIETLLGGKFFFTDRRLPIRQAIEDMRIIDKTKKAQGDLDFGCKNDICGV